MKDIEISVPEHLVRRLNKAQEILETASINVSQWQLGGGSALEMMMHHRKSEDIDIFAFNPYIVSMMSPRLNDAIDCSEYIESAACTKLIFDDYQIDFICASNMTDCELLKHDVGDGTHIYIEHPLEVISKKYSIALHH